MRTIDATSPNLHDPCNRKALVASTATQASESEALAARDEGIGFWKAYTPQGFKGELDSYDPIELIGGALISSINWRDQDGKLYCFASATSLNYFQDFPKAIFARRAKPSRGLRIPSPARELRSHRAELLGSGVGFGPAPFKACQRTPLLG